MHDLRVVINADDFGADISTNQAIIEAFDRRLCSSTTIMANMPGFEHACRLCHEKRLVDRTGIHLVLSEGWPLSDAIRNCPRICMPDGRFRDLGRPLLHRLNRDEKNAIKTEICTQIDKCRSSGLPLTHIDSHKHVHVEWGVVGPVLEIARLKGIRYIRLARDQDVDSMWIKNLYRRFVNLRLRSAGFALTNQFGTVEDFRRLIGRYKSSKWSFEVMVHPCYNGCGRLIDRLSGQPLEEYIRALVPYRVPVPFPANIEVNSS